jgi:hypothetical protein
LDEECDLTYWTTTSPPNSLRSSVLSVVNEVVGMVTVGTSRLGHIHEQVIRWIDPVGTAQDSRLKNHALEGWGAGTVHVF